MVKYIRSKTQINLFSKGRSVAQLLTEPTTFFSGNWRKTECWGRKASWSYRDCHNFWNVVEGQSHNKTDFISFSIQWTTWFSYHRLIWKKRMEVNFLMKEKKCPYLSTKKSVKEASLWFWRLLSVWWHSTISFICIDIFKASRFNHLWNIWNINEISIKASQTSFRYYLFTLAGYS